MLYLVGGASRAGKSFLAEQLRRDRGVANFCLDLLRCGLGKGAPELGIDPNLPDDQDVERLWPIIEEMAACLVDDERDYLMEGVSLTPAHVAAFTAAHPGRVRGCFLGYAGLEPEAKLRNVRALTSGPGDWTQAYGDAEILEHVTHQIARSERLMRECEAVGLAYFDTGADFEGGVRAAYGWLLRRGS